MEYKYFNNKGSQFLLIGVLIVSLLSVGVSSFSVGFENTELRLNPGEEYETAFSLQNYGIEAQDITVKATIEEGGEYVSFPQGTIFSISANNNVAAPIKVIIPQNAKVGDKHNIKVLFNAIIAEGESQKSQGEGTTIGFAFSYRRSIDLIVVPAVETNQEVQSTEEKTSAGSTVWIWILAILVLIIVVWLIIKKRNSN
ncbi:MAG: hypothetical protein Q7S27_02370 [Nanoarchaeota archaeon]|nr:hypothetical protein [Nanoarchaeota archaeon]